MVIFYTAQLQIGRSILPILKKDADWDINHVKNKQKWVRRGGLYTPHVDFRDASGRCYLKKIKSFGCCNDFDTSHPTLNDRVDYCPVSTISVS